MSDKNDYIVTSRKAVDVSTFDKNGSRVERHAKKGETVQLTEARAASLVNLVEKKGKAAPKKEEPKKDSTKEGTK